MPRITFLTITNYLEALANKHVSVNDSYRWNATEFTNALRQGVNLPVMLIDAVETQPEGDHTKTIHRNSTAFTVLGKPNTSTGNLDAYAAQNEVLELCQGICFDMETRILHDAQQPLDAQGNKNWLYGLIDKNSFHHFKVGPITVDALYGYRCEVTLKNTVSTQVETEKWNDL